MIQAAYSSLDLQVVVLAPTRRDGEVCCAVLAKAQIDCRVVKGIEELCTHLRDSAVGAVILTDDPATRRGLTALIEVIARQPSWSDLPIMLLSRPGADVLMAGGQFGKLTNVTILDRPTSSRALISAVAAALRGRERQYQIRDQLRTLERAQGALQESADQMALAVQLAGLALAEVNYERGSVRLSSEAAKLFGIAGTAQEIPLDELLSAIHIEDREQLSRSLGQFQLQEVRAEFAVNYRVIWPDGRMRWVSHMHQVMFSEGTPSRAVIVALDVTEQTNADRRKDEFLATLAHELRNPLAPIRTGLQALARAGNDESVLNRLRPMMERQLGQMVRLIDDLLDVSRISSGKVVLQKERFDLRKAIELAVEASQPFISAEKHEFILQMPDEAMWVNGDASRLSQVVTNLLNNAAKYTPSGGRIRVSLTGDSGEALIQVDDSGLGIPAEMIDQVFTLFTQVNRTLDRAQGGLGVGLSLVREMINLHGGTVNAYSDGPGRGSSFTVRLPLLADQSDRTRTAAAGAPIERGSQGLRVLVVDDINDVAETMAMLLDLEGFEVRIANNGPDALEIARHFKPDVVLCDIGLPRMDGHEIARQLRLLDRLEPLTLVAMTGWGGEDDMRKTRESGYDFHLVKPVSADVVKAILSDRSARPMH